MEKRIFLAKFSTLFIQLQMNFNKISKFGYDPGIACKTYPLQHLDNTNSTIKDDEFTVGTEEDGASSDRGHFPLRMFGGEKVWRRRRLSGRRRRTNEPTATAAKWEIGKFWRLKF
jgi:hypothetical protein